MSNKVLQNKYEIKKIKLSQIKEGDKTLIDIEEKEIETQYVMKDVTVMSDDAAIYFLLLHPIIVTAYKKNNEAYYKVIAGKRTYQIVNTIFNDTDKILVLIVKIKNGEMLRDISKTDCVGTPFAYSCCDRRSLKKLVTRMKGVFSSLFPVLKYNEDIASILGKTAETIFYNKRDRKPKEIEGIKNNISEDVKVNISKIYPDKGIEK